MNEVYMKKDGEFKPLMLAIGTIPNEDYEALMDFQSKESNYDSHLINAGIHITSAERTKWNEKSTVKTETITFNLSIAAGTIGTRGYQGDYTPTKYSVEDVIGLTVTQSGSTANYILQPFVSSGKIYLNAYRCITGAASATIKVRVAYLA